MNEQPPQRFNNKIIYICLLVETSDGRKIHFARIRYGENRCNCTRLSSFSGSKLGSGQNIDVPALLTSPDQIVNCYVMCDGIGIHDQAHELTFADVH